MTAVPYDAAVVLAGKSFPGHRSDAWAAPSVALADNAMLTKRKTLSIFGLTLLCTPLLALAAPSTAEACGGTFCDSGPQVMPVDQTGETIVFALGEGKVEAHIQIQYDGDPERFAWLIPVMAVPDIEVGSQAFLAQLQNGTRPVNTMDYEWLGCLGEAPSMGCGGGDGLGDLGGGDTGGMDPFDDEEDPDVDILKRGVAGAFEYVVITADDIGQITSWLDDNDYAQDDEAPPILAEYLDEGFVFVAIKLRGNAGNDEIHPIVVRYDGDEPCVPIRLTRIAASQDMPIRALFLGDARTAPTNFAHVVPNPLLFDWFPTIAGDYADALTLAIDEAPNGHGFITQYAGPSNIINRQGIEGSAWDISAFEGLSVVDVVDVLTEQNLMACAEDTGCNYAHAQVQPLLERYVPIPEGMTDAEFYSCLSCNEAEIDMVAWDSTMFEIEVETRIFEPGAHANELLDNFPYLTRLYTTLSPHEMTVDPLFHENPDLPDVDLVYQPTWTIACEGPNWVTFPDGREMTMAPGDDDPLFTEMPYAERIETVPPAGAPMVDVDNRELIDTMLADHQAAYPFIPRDDQRIDDPDDDESGFRLCGSRVTGFSGPGLAYMGLILGLGALGRRRRRKATEA